MIMIFYIKEECGKYRCYKIRSDGLVKKVQISYEWFIELLYYSLVKLF